MNNIHCRSCYYRNKGRTEWENELAPLLEEVWTFTQPFTLGKEIHPRVRKIYDVNRRNDHLFSDSDSAEAWVDGVVRIRLEALRSGYVLSQDWYVKYLDVLNEERRLLAKRVHMANIPANWSISKTANFFSRPLHHVMDIYLSHDKTKSKVILFYLVLLLFLMSSYFAGLCLFDLQH